MIKTHSDDPDVVAAAQKALEGIHKTLASLPKATVYDYGGETLKLGKYGVCITCATPIAEAQAAEQALRQQAAKQKDETVKEHLALAADFFRREAEAAIVRAKLHNGQGTEGILDQLLGYQFERGIHDDYHHSHHGGKA
ncbi:MAG TPA: hypothetical protein VLE99_06470 [Candidatus Saccharimonadales bacterium]|nr:hypothetical protein [Candidatus Saccharimonadales bacterium]